MSNAYHDTPPPTVIGDGSLSIELRDALTIPSTSSNGRWIHVGRPNTPIVHVKVLHGSGDIIYRNLEADDSRIIILLEDANHDPVGDLIITGGTLFQVDSDQKLVHQGVGAAKRLHKFGHPGAGPDAFRVKSIEISKTTSPLAQFKVTAPRTSGDSQEYRIMIWHEGD
ncbi:MAG TPA: hypothetical protein VKC61_16765 [Pyrinomonadaceae bacterium]|nr:hypothetical protein [Pyrinomonadaceae bacterium]